MKVYSLNTAVQKITITGLEVGQTCFYTLSASCGAITFYPSDTSKVEIEYAEFDVSQLSSFDSVIGYGQKGSNDPAKRASSPAV